MPASLDILFGTAKLTLLGDRALYWADQNSLVLADVHLGKDASFRAAGLAVPAGNSAKDLGRIQALLLQTRASRLVILGDLVHSRSSHQEELSASFCRWRADHPQLEILLIRGNHDRHAGPTPDNWNITQVIEPYPMGSLNLAHFPRENGDPVLCGHLHPTINVRDYDRSFAAIPCFVMDPGQLILPAFGSFTGGCKVGPAPGRRIFAATGKSVVAVAV